jgi:sugar phosphate isomerase/epimerase
MMPGRFADDVAACADAGCNALEVWLTKLETHLEREAPAATRRLLADRGVTLAAASYQGGLLLSQGEQRRTHYDQFQRRLSLCQEFGIGTLLIAPDFATELDASALERAVGALRHAAQLASAFDVRLALEFQSSSRWCASLDTALALVAAADAPNLGIAFDVFHYYTGPSKFEDLGALTADRLAFVQLCDLAGVPRELAVDADRILPGDGDFQLGPLLDHFRRIGYQGWVSAEVPNPDLWKMNPLRVAEAAVTALRRLLGQAGMPPELTRAL